MRLIKTCIRLYDMHTLLQIGNLKWGTRDQELQCPHQQEVGNFQWRPFGSLKCRAVALFGGFGTQTLEHIQSTPKWPLVTAFSSASKSF